MSEQARPYTVKTFQLGENLCFARVTGPDCDIVWHMSTKTLDRASEIHVTPDHSAWWIIEFTHAYGPGQEQGSKWIPVHFSAYNDQPGVACITTIDESGDESIWEIGDHIDAINLALTAKHGDRIKWFLNRAAIIVE